MNYESFIKKMTGDIGKIPSEVKIFTVRQYSIFEMQERTDKLLKQFSQNEQFYFERGDKVQEKERTLIRLPKGGRAIFYHASGNIKVVAGLNPMENLFDNKAEKPGIRIAWLKRFSDSSFLLHFHVN